MSNLVCGSQSPCFGGASHLIFKGMAGEGCRLVVGFFYHQIRIRAAHPGGGGVPDHPAHVDGEPSDYNQVEVEISIKWPFMDKWKRISFIMERRWANVIVNRINQINTFNEQFSVKFTNFQNGFKVKYSDFKDKFGVKWKK